MLLLLMQFQISFQNRIRLNLIINEKDITRYLLMKIIQNLYLKIEQLEILLI